MYRRLKTVFPTCTKFAKTCTNDSEAHNPASWPPCPHVLGRPGWWWAEWEVALPQPSSAGQAERGSQGDRPWVVWRLGSPAEGLAQRPWPHLPKLPSPFYSCCPMPACGCADWRPHLLLALESHPSRAQSRPDQRLCAQLGVGVLQTQQRPQVSSGTSKKI